MSPSPAAVSATKQSRMDSGCEVGERTGLLVSTVPPASADSQSVAEKIEPKTRSTRGTDRAGQSSQAAPRRNRLGKYLAALLLLLVASATAGWLAFSGSGEPRDLGIAETALVEVTRAPLELWVNASGVVQSRSNVVLASKVSESTKILEIVPEGKRVEKGEVICRLDASEFEQEVRERLVLVTRADADLAQAEEDVRIQRLLNAQQIAEAETALELARLDLEKYRNGEYVQKANQLAGEITLSRENLTRAEEYLAFVERLARKGYATQGELEEARLSVTKQRIALANAEQKRDVLEDYDRKRRLAELEARVEEAERELRRVKLVANAALLKATVILKARERRALIHRSRLERAQQDVDHCTIRAPQAGTVVYANDRASRSSSRSLIEVGSQVRPRQAIVMLPDLEHMQVKARIHESQIRHVAEGQPVVLRVSALASQALQGRVASISAVPLSSRDPFSGRREYEAVIDVTGPLAADHPLRPGLTAEVDILVDRRENVLQVPIESVVHGPEGDVCLVWDGEGFERRVVRVGQSSTSATEILDGLREGEKVLRDPRLTDLQSTP